MTTIERIIEGEFIRICRDVVPPTKTAFNIYHKGVEDGLKTALKILRREIVISEDYDWKIGG